MRLGWYRFWFPPGRSSFSWHHLRQSFESVNHLGGCLLPLNGQQYIAINGYEGKALALLESISCSSIKFEFACPVPERTGHVPQDLDWEEAVPHGSYRGSKLKHTTRKLPDSCCISVTHYEPSQTSYCRCYHLIYL